MSVSPWSSGYNTMSAVGVFGESLGSGGRTPEEEAGFALYIAQYYTPIHAGTHRNTPEHAGTHWYTMVHTGTHWCTLVHTGAHWCTRVYTGVHSTRVHTGTHRYTLVHTVSRSITDTVTFRRD